MKISASARKRTLVSFVVTAFITVHAAVAALPVTTFAAANLNQNAKNANGVLMSSKGKFNDARKSNTEIPATVITSITTAIESVGSKVTTQKKSDSMPNTSPTSEHKITLCHRTASYSNPYVMISVDQNAADGLAGNSGNRPDHYGEHQGPIFYRGIPKHTEWGDIIPPIHGVHDGLNWNSTGQKIHSTGCYITTENQDSSQHHEGKDHGSKVTLCHATGSETNSFVKITVATSAAYHAHIHHQDGEDIIPPFEYKNQTHSLNWTNEGKQIYNDDCNDKGIIIANDKENNTVVSQVLAESTITETRKGDILPETGSGTSALIAIVSGLGLITLSGTLMLATRAKLGQ